jgi:hypothetical protein
VRSRSCQPSPLLPRDYPYGIPLLCRSRVNQCTVHPNRIGTVQHRTPYCPNPLIFKIAMGNFGSSRRRRWRGVPLGGHLQRGCLFAFAGCDGEAKTSLIAEYCRPELVHRGGKPTARQISEHARALKSIGAKRVRRTGSEWVWRLCPDERIARAGVVDVYAADRHFDSR